MKMLYNKKYVFFWTNEDYLFYSILIENWNKSVNNFITRYRAFFIRIITCVNSYNFPHQNWSHFFFFSKALREKLQFWPDYCVDITSVERTKKPLLYFISIFIERPYVLLRLKHFKVSVSKWEIGENLIIIFLFFLKRRKLMYQLQNILESL